MSRVLAIRNQIEFIIESNIKKNEQNSIQVLNLGCGMDSLYFYLKEKYPTINLKLLEIDYHDITKKKVKFIQTSKKLSEKLIDFDDKSISECKKKLITKDYIILDCDLTQGNKVQNCIKESNLDSNILTIVIAECFFCYLSSEEVNDLLSILNKNFNNSILLYYDLINPNDDFGKMMIKNLKNFRGIILPGYKDCPDEKSHIKRISDNGFINKSNCIEMLKYFNEILSEEIKKKVNKLELIDELEEWNLLQKHSCIGYAIKVNKIGVDYDYDFLDQFSFK